MSKTETALVVKEPATTVLGPDELSKMRKAGAQVLEMPADPERTRVHIPLGDGAIEVPYDDVRKVALKALQGVLSAKLRQRVGLK